MLGNNGRCIMNNSLLQESLQNCKPVDFMTVFDADVKIWFWVTKFGKQYPYTCLPWIVEDLHRCFPVFSWNHIHSVRNWNDPPSNSPPNHTVTGSDQGSLLEEEFCSQTPAVLSDSHQRISAFLEILLLSCEFNRILWLRGKSNTDVLHLPLPSASVKEVNCVETALGAPPIFILSKRGWNRLEDRIMQDVYCMLF